MGELTGRRASYRRQMGEEQRSRLAVVLDRALSRAEVSHPQLSEILAQTDPSIHLKTISDWRTARATVPFYHAQAIAKILAVRDADTSSEVFDHFGYDPVVMIRAFGLFPDDEDHAEILTRLAPWSAVPTDVDVVDRLLELEHLDAEIEEREEELAEVERDRGAVALVRAVIDSKKYGVAVWPVFAGTAATASGRIHVSDRIDIRRLDGEPIDDRRVWEDLHQHLTRARALPSIAEPRWSRPPSQLPSDSAELHVSRWNIRRLDAPRRPRIQRRHPDLPAVAISATVSNTWLGYIASMVAFVLGYGLTSTTDLARNHRSDLSFNPGTDARNAVHDGLLTRPGERRVWSHAAKVDLTNDLSPWAPRHHRSEQPLLHVRLVEDDALLESTATDRVRQPGFIQSEAEAVSSWRESRDRALERMPNDNWHLALQVPDAAWGSLAKWEFTIDLAIQILQHIEGMGLKPWDGMAEMHEIQVQRDPAVTGATLKWLKERGAPFLS